MYVSLCNCVCVHPYMSVYVLNVPTKQQLNGSVKPIPPPRDHLRIEKDGRLTNRAPVPAPQVPDRKLVPVTPPQLPHVAQVVEPTPDQLDSIKKFQVSKTDFVLLA